MKMELGTGSTRFAPNVEATFAGVRLPADLDHGFEVSGTEIVFRGRCVECQAAEDGQHPGYRPGSAADRHPPAGSPPPGDTHTNG